MFVNRHIVTFQIQRCELIF